MRHLQALWLSWFSFCLLLICMPEFVAQPESGEDLPALLKKLESPFSGEVTAAARAIGRLGPKAKAAVPPLNHALTRAHFSDERVALARALGAMGPAAEEAAPTLALALKRAGFPLERQAILKALGQIGAGARSAVPTLVEVMRTGLPDDARLAAQVLGEIGPAARDAVPALRMAAQSGFSHLKATAADSLRKIQVNDIRFGILDQGRFFNPNALQAANRELQDMAARQQLGVRVETYSYVPAEQAARLAGRGIPEGIDYVQAWAQERVLTADFNGLLVLVCRNPSQVAVVPTPTLRAAFDPASCAKLREEILARVHGRQPDEALQDIVAFMKGRSANGPSRKQMP